MPFRPLLFCAALIGAGFALAPENSSAQENPVDVVAAAVRQAGHACRDPQSAKPDPEHSSPQEKAWIIHCKNGAYRVKFRGDRGATVEPIGGN